MTISGRAACSNSCISCRYCRDRVIAPNLITSIADRFLFLVRLLAAVDAGLLLSLNAAIGGLQAWRRFVNHAADGPDRLGKGLVVFHAEDDVGYLVAEAFPHVVELFHADAFVFSLGIDLRISNQTDALTQVIHGE